MFVYWRYILAKNIDMVVIVPVVLASFAFFPIFGLMNGFATIGQESFIISCIFIAMWLLVLFIAIKFRSKAIFNVYIYYWLAVNIVSLLTAFTDSLGGLGQILTGFFITPTIGIFHLSFTNDSRFDFAMFTVVLLALLAGGLFAKRKVI